MRPTRETSSSANRSILASALCALLSLAGLLAPPGAAAQSGADEWQFRATIYGWLPNMKATTNFPSPSGSITVDADEIIDALQGVFMGTLEARKGRWGAFTDVIYFDLGDSGTVGKPFTIGGAVLSVPGNAFLSGDINIKGWVWTLAGQYTAIQEPTHELNLFAGFRYLNVSTDFSWAFTGNVGPVPLALRQGAVSASDTVWDAIVGTHGTVKLGNEGWFLPYYLDVGTGDSNLTWQAMAGVGYQFKWGDVVAAYRYLDYNLPSGKPVEDLSMYGPLLGVTFRF